MGFEDLRAFLLVAEEGSFLSAAERLGVSRTTLRRQVDALEAQVGVPLLDRGARGAVLTEAGRRLQERGRVMEQEFSALLRSARETATRPEGEVRLLVQIGLPPALINTLFAMFRSSWPAVRLRTRFSEQPIDADLANVDVVVWFGLTDPGEAWETHTVFPLRLRLFAARSYLQSRGTPRSLDELQSHDLLAWQPYAEREPRLVARDGTLHPLQPILATTNVDLIHQFARAGLGVAWAPDAGLPPPPGEDPLIPVLEDQAGSRTEVRLAVPKALAQAPRIRVFVEMIDSIRGMVQELSSAAP